MAQAVGRVQITEKAYRKENTTTEWGDGEKIGNKINNSRVKTSFVLFLETNTFWDRFINIS